MRSIVVQAFITIDGVVQAVGGPDEDREGAFAHGGWASDYDAAASARLGDDGGEGQRIVEQWESKTEALLLGRKTYQIFAGAWGVWDENAPGLQGELTRRYNRIPKYVASRTLTELGWQNSQLLGPDIAAAVDKLRTSDGGEIRVWGSTQLIKALAEHDLIDEYRLVCYPLVLGTGKRLFSDGFPLARLTLAETRALPTGVAINIYRRSA